MGKKRKRPARSKDLAASSQTSSTAAPGRFKPSVSAAPNSQSTTHPVISLYYRQLLTLRQYLLNQLPISSKSRRRRLASLSASSQDGPHCAALSALLDSTLVGVLKERSPSIDSNRQREYQAFTQSQSRSILASTDTGPNSPQSEVVDFVIDQLFKHHGDFRRFQHLLTHGFQRASSFGAEAPDSNIPGIVVRSPNHNVRTLKESPWTEILGYLGQSGDEIMLRLLLDCGVFTSIDAKRGVYYQLSGLALSELQQINKNPLLDHLPTNTSATKKSKQDHGTDCRSPNNIVLLRRSMLYSKFGSPLGKRVASGLGKTHVLNRYASLDSTAHSIHVMMYMFPRQFRLRNMFASTPGHNVRTDHFKSQAFREGEIFEDERNLKVPKRLRGAAIDLVRALRVRHSRCSYAKMLGHYCPTELNGPWKMANLDDLQSSTEETPQAGSSAENLVTQLPRKSLSNRKFKTRITTATTSKSKVEKPRVCLTDYATPSNSVSAFCRAVLLKVIPMGFFGHGPDGEQNRRIIMKHADCFIKLRRFENLTLHEITKGLKITAMDWLNVPDAQGNENRGAKMALSDFQKRTELLHEFVFYIFDSILVPLVRHNFYVTESQTHRNQLFYFRHDVWQRLTEQPFKSLKVNMLEEIEPAKFEQMKPYRKLGCGSLRLLPKSAGIRPILNLRGRPLKQRAYGGKTQSYLAASVNSSLAPVYSMLTYERKRDPASVGSSLQFVGDIHHRIKEFKQSLIQRLSTPSQKHPRLPQLYFVKLDIQACFDNIPQTQLVQLVEGLLSEQSYHITKHVEMSAPPKKVQGKLSRKFVARAAPISEQKHLPDLVANGEQGHKGNTVFVDAINEKQHTTDELFRLLCEHVLSNTVQTGKKHFRQRNGIAQGSVLSSLLCNFFYARVEKEVLDFLQPKESLLMRLVDDFLLITTDREQATRFLETMIRGQPAYNVAVNPAKSMTNFSVAVDGIHVPRLEGSPLLPYCGLMIDTHTLEISRDTDRVFGDGAAAATISNTLTVEANRLPGAAFTRKVLTPFKLHIQPMYLDDVHNSRSVVLANLYTGLINAAMRMYRYMKSLRTRAHPTTEVIIQTIKDLIHQTFAGIKARRESTTAPLSCFVQLRHIQYLTVAAFRFVLQRKQTRYAAVLRWLDTLGRQTRPTSNTDAVRLMQVVKKGTALFREWRF